MSSSFFNTFKSTEVRGGFKNSANGTEAAYAKVEGTLELGLEATTTVTDPETGLSSQVYTNTGGDIVFKIQGQTYTLTRDVLRFLVNVNADVQNQLDAKASRTYVDGQISHVEDELLDKVDVTEYNDGMSDVYSELAEKLDTSVYNSDQTSMLTLVNSKAATTYVDSGLTTKVDSTTYNTDQAAMTTLVNSKATTTYVDTQDASLLSNINTRATTTQLTDGLALKANDSEVVKLTSTQTIGGQKTFSLLPQSSATPTAASDLVTKTWVEANYTPNGTSATYATKTYVDTQDAALLSNINTRATVTQLTDGLALKANDSEVVKLTSTQTIGGQKTFSLLPQSSATPTAASDLVTKTWVEANYTPNGTSATYATKTYVDTQDAALLSNINTRALDSAVVKLTGDQTVAGVKSFSSLPTSTLTPTLADQLTRKGYVDAGDATLLSNINTRALDSAVVKLTGDQTVAGVKTLTGNIIANSQTVTPTQLGFLSGTTSNIQTQLGGCVKLAVANTITATCAFSNTVTITGNVVAGTQTVTPTQLSYVSGATQNLQQQINARALDSAVVKLGAIDQTVQGTKTFSSPPQCSQGLTVTGGSLNTNIIASYNNAAGIQCTSQLYGDTPPYCVSQGLAGWIVNMNNVQSRITPLFCSQYSLIDNDFDSFYILAVS